MEFLLIILLLIAYPIFGLYQVLNAITSYFEEGNSQAFYDNLERYASIVFAYFILGIILWNPFVSLVIPEAVYLIYLFGLSFPIAVYNIVIMNTEYPEESINTFTKLT